VSPGRAVVITWDLVPGDVDRFLIRRTPRDVLTASLYDEAAGEFHDSLLEVQDSRGRPVAVDDDSGPGFLSNLAIDTSHPHGPTIVAVTGFDPHPDDAVPHPENFRYRLVLSLQRPPHRGYAR
jgi:hypothetical protein